MNTNTKLAILLGSLVLFGCGGGGGNSSTEPVQPTTPDVVEPVQPEPTVSDYVAEDHVIGAVEVVFHNDGVITGQLDESGKAFIILTANDETTPVIDNQDLLKIDAQFNGQKDFFYYVQYPHKAEQYTRSNDEPFDERFYDTVFSQYPFVNTPIEPVGGLVGLPPVFVGAGVIVLTGEAFEVFTIDFSENIK